MVTALFSKRFFVTVFCFMVGIVAGAQSALASDAHAVAEQVKNDLVAVIKNKATLEKEGGEQKYFDAVEAVLVPVVDFKYIARGVMGEYGKQATEEQREEFAKVFQKGLVSTYAKGLAGYGDHEITIVPPKEGEADKRSVGVVLQVRGGDSTNVLSFSMKQNRSDEWKLTNMVLNGINLGKTFRNQFAQSMQKKGDLNEVIKGWRV